MTTSRRFPVIGLPASELPSAGEKPARLGIERAYVKALEVAGAAPLLIPMLDDAERLRAIYALLDGLVFPGGEDIAPSAYGEEPIQGLNTIHPLRDRVELTLARWALDSDLATLGICRGQQLLNVAMGGTLFQDLCSQGATSFDHSRRDGRPGGALVHPVRLDPGSRLAQLIDETTLDVNSSHHQAVRDIAPTLRATAIAPDGVIEAVEAPDRRFVVAVQWHPERLMDLPWVPRLFRGLVEAAVQQQRP